MLIIAIVSSILALCIGLAIGYKLGYNKNPNNELMDKYKNIPMIELNDLYIVRKEYTIRAYSKFDENVWMISGYLYK